MIFIGKLSENKQTERFIFGIDMCYFFKAADVEKQRIWNISPIYQIQL